MGVRRSEVMVMRRAKVDGAERNEEKAEWSSEEADGVGQQYWDRGGG